MTPGPGRAGDAAAEDDRPLAGRAALVTGAGRGLGREYALTLARLGAAVLVNDLGSAVDGTAGGAGADAGAAQAVADEITAAGGRAVADRGDVRDWAAAGALVGRAVGAFGRLDVLVNNAGILRPRTLAGMTEAEWDDVIAVHLRGSAAMTHFAAVHWREQAKAGQQAGGRLINTTSGSGLYGNGQANYAAAKAGIAALTLIAADELARYAVTANAVAPIARTRMAIGSIPESYRPQAAAVLVGWLASARSAGVTGRVFNVGGGHVSIADGWHAGPAADRAGPWTLAELDQIVPGLAARAKPRPDLLGYYPAEPRSPHLPDLRYTVPGPPG